MPEIINWLETNPFLGVGVVTKILGSLATIVIVWLLRRWIVALILRRVKDPKQGYNIRRNSNYLATFVVVIIIAITWLENAREFVTYLGLLSAGVAIALKDPLSNIIGWAALLWQRPFKIGDRIQIGQYAGDVIDINLFQFSLMEIGNWVADDQSTGRIVHIPNSLIFTEPQANSTEEFEYIWNEISITITYESDWQLAKEILTAIAEKHAAPADEIHKILQERQSSKYLYFYTHVTPFIYTSIAEIGVMLTARYMCQSRERRISALKIQEDVLLSFNQEKTIDFAYPTRRTIVT